ncbi:type II secretion system F family protein [Agromyces indicus]|uniref:Type II secretion system F family protein n=1 Tax=Agromyces indicus TaxID=758919 RepID=A0ABU1FH16_9MICO|nr:type II secretion system F family protein [Agromyces indicus]MDR5691043.1 type II secretion system F family protein [Agromyces indicus]
MGWEILGYAAVAATVVGIAAFVFLLFPARKTVSSNASADAAVLTQQPSMGASLVTAAPQGYVGWLGRQIVLAGRPAGLTVARILRRKIVLGVLAAVVGALVIAIDPHPFRILLSIAGVLMLFFLADVRINSQAHDRQDKIQRALPDTLDQMTIAVEAGLGFDAAMAKAARGGHGPLAEELVRVLQDMSIGRSRRDAFHELEGRTNVEELRRFVRAVIQADAYGISVGDVLRVQSGEMRLKRRQRAEEAAQKVTVKILFPLIFCLLPVLFIVILTPAVLQIIERFA